MADADTFRMLEPDDEQRDAVDVLVSHLARLTRLLERVYERGHGGGYGVESFRPAIADTVAHIKTLTDRKAIDR